MQQHTWPAEAIPLVQRGNTLEATMKQYGIALLAEKKKLSETADALMECGRYLNDAEHNLTAGGCDLNRLGQTHDLLRYTSAQEFVVNESVLQATEGSQAQQELKLQSLSECLKKNEELSSEVSTWIQKTTSADERAHALCEAIVKNAYKQVLNKACESATHLQQLRTAHAQLTKQTVQDNEKICSSVTNTSEQLNRTKNVSYIQKSMLSPLEETLLELKALGNILSNEKAVQRDTLAQLESQINAPGQTHMQNVSDETRRLVRQLPLTLDDFSLVGNCDEKQLGEIARSLNTEPKNLAKTVEAIGTLGEIAAEINEAKLEYEKEQKQLVLKRAEQHARAEAAIKTAGEAAEHFKKEMAIARAEHFAKEVRSAMERLCASAIALGHLKENAEVLKGRAVDLTEAVSMEYRKWTTEWKTERSDLQTNAMTVVDVFTYASKNIALLNETLKAIDDTYDRAGAVLSHATNEGEKNNGNWSEDTWKFVASITSSIKTFSPQSVCTIEGINALVTSIKNKSYTEDQPALVGGVEYLKELAKKLDVDVKVVERTMARAVLRAAKAQEVAEQASGMAEETRCTPFYHQPLNLLVKSW
ncbi:hypothetical protein ERJ75_000180300 [Trypanosoma vivax]|nr:hypothetical protein ERJ75_000180300 [Trypanosoma vivax]